MKTTKEIIESADLNYEYFVDSARSIVRELEQGYKKHICPHYLREKIRYVLNILEEINDEKERQKVMKK